MKKKIAVLAIILCLATTSTVFARGNSHGSHGGYGNSHHYGSSHYGFRGGHRDHGLGIAVGVVGGLLLGSALVHAATPPPARVVYGAPYPPYQPGVVVQEQRICLEDRVVSGEWQISNYDGRQVWVPFPYPVTQRVRIPCY